MYSPAIGWEKRLNKLTFENWPIEILRGREFVLSFSGGADSVLALYLLLACRQIFDPQKLILFYLDHGLSFPESSIADRRRILQMHVDFTASLLGRDKVNFVEVRRDVKKISRKLKVSFERAGSLLRRRHLVRAATTSAPIFVTGHSLADWLETVVLRLNRGAGPESLQPFNTFRTEGGMEFLHPVADLSREEVRALLRELTIPWWEDPSNDDMQIARNRVRSVLEFHPEGLRRARKNFLVSVAPGGATAGSGHAGAAFSAGPVFQEISSEREYHLRLDYFFSQNEINRQSLLLRGLAAVGLTPVNRAVRAALLKKPHLHYGPWHLETENWQGFPMLVFRRGRSRLPQFFSEGAGFLSASELPAAAAIRLSYGHKKVKKIFSELKLSARQRQALLVEIDPDDCRRVIKIYLESFGLKNIVEISR